MDQGEAAIVGVLVGSLISMLLPLVQWWQKGKSLRSVISYEQERSIRAINDRMKWLGIPAPAETIEKYPNKIVEVEGKQLKLSQSENISLPLEFWNKHCVELAGAMSANGFRKFADKAVLIQQFERKDHDMLKAFQNSNVDQAKEMAVACYSNLLEIQSRLNAP